MTENQRDLYEGIPSPIRPLTQYKELIPHIGEAFANALMEIIPIYHTSEFLEEMHSLCRRKEFSPVGMGRISYQDQYLLGYLGRVDQKSAYAAYCAGYSLRSPLMAYEFLLFDNRHANSFGVIHHQGISRYDDLWQSNTIDPSVRQELYENLCALARQDIWIAPAALAYCPENRDFKVLNFQEVRLGKLSTPEKLADYQAQYRTLLQIPSPTNPDHAHEGGHLMPRLYVFSGPCGSGKSTLSSAWAAHLVHACARNQAYVIHGDDFHRGFVETDRRVGPSCPGFLYWPDILRFNWDCILSVARRALDRGLDVIIDYVVEDELPLLVSLAREKQARLFYVVLTASEEELTQRLTQRGSSHLIERSLFLKDKLERAAEHAPYLYHVGGKTVEQELSGLDMSRYEVFLS